MNPAREIIEICRRLYARNMLAAADGNVSFRLNENEVLITPSGVHKGFLQESDLARVTIAGDVLEGTPSSEKWMHLQIYKSCPQAKAVVHAHPPHVIAFSLAFPGREFFPSEYLGELVLALNRVPFVPYAIPTTQDMGKNLTPYLPESKVLILSRHGALAWGESLQEAYNGMERIEHSAEILKHAAELAGGFERLQTIPQADLEILLKMRRQMGNRNL